MNEKKKKGAHLVSSEPKETYSEETAEHTVDTRSRRERREAEERAAAEAKSSAKRKKQSPPPENTEYADIGGISGKKERYESSEEERERRKRTKKKKKGSFGRKLGIVLLVIFVLLLAAGGTAVYLGHRVSNSPLNLPNVYVNGIFVGGMTDEQTRATLDQFRWDDMTNTPLKVELLCNVKFDIDMCESGMMMTKDAAIEAVRSYGHDGDWFENLLTYGKNLITAVDVNSSGNAVNTQYIRSKVDAAVKAVEEAVPPSDYVLDREAGTLTVIKGAGELKMNADKLYDSVYMALQKGEKQLTYTELAAEPTMPDYQAIYTELAIDPVDAYYDFDTKTVVEDVDGFTFDVAAAEKLWSSANIIETVTVPVQVVEPEITKEELEATLFKDVLGAMETTYGIGDTNRVNNLHLALGKIDGIILNPGEEFSYNDVIGQRTEEAGFLPAGAYDNGEVVQEVGGGVCQVSSTLYSATLYAQLPAIERTNHYFKVDYLDYGMDATVSWPKPNFRFKNTRDYPVKIHAFYNDEYDYGVGGMRIEILGTDVDGSYVKIWREIFTIPHPEFDWIGIGYSVFQHRDIYDKDGNLIRSETYDYYDEYYFHEEVYADKVEQARGAGSAETDISFG